MENPELPAGTDILIDYHCFGQTTKRTCKVSPKQERVHIDCTVEFRGAYNIKQVFNFELKENKFLVAQQLYTPLCM